MNDPQDQSVFVKGLSYAAGALLVILLGYLYFDDALEEQRNPNRSPTSSLDGNGVTVELQRNRAGHYMSSGKINSKDVVFLLDTGATDVSIPAKVAEVIGLQRGRAIQVYTANGIVTVYSTVLSNIQLGDIVLRDIEANINPHMGGEEILLGMSFLGKLDFSQRGDRLSLHQFN